MKASCLQVIKDNSQSATPKFHATDITCFALHHERPIVISGDLKGAVYLSHY
jgi:hypothetical protein